MNQKTEKHATNHDGLITNLRYNATVGEFTYLTQFATDCIVYDFPEKMNSEQIVKFTEFMDTSDNMNDKTAIDFCLYFIDNKIPFVLSWKLCKKMSMTENMDSLMTISKIKKELKKSRYYSNLMAHRL